MDRRFLDNGTSLLAAAFDGVGTLMEGLGTAWAVAVV